MSQLKNLPIETPLVATEINDLKTALSKWSSTLSDHPYQNLGEKISFKTGKKLSSYRVTFLSQVEVRSLQLISKPSKKVNLSPVTVKASSIDVWASSLPMQAHFRETKQQFEVDGTQELHDCSACSTHGEVACPDCSDGMVDCSTCNAHGELRCGECQGHGAFTCRSCDTDGEVDCPKCNDGRTSCDACYGSGYRECNACQGFKTNNGVPCSACGGAGHHVCGRCHGSQKIDCRHCGGRGRQRCGSCGGKHTWSCARCRGSGNVTCGTCRGNQRVECPTCHRKMKVTCSRCQGQGYHLAAQFIIQESKLKRILEELPMAETYAARGGSSRYRSLDERESALFKQNPYTIDELDGRVRSAVEKVLQAYQTNPENHLVAQKVTIEVDQLFKFTYEVDGKTYECWFEPTKNEIHHSGKNPIDNYKDGFLSQKMDQAKKSYETLRYQTTLNALTEFSRVSQKDRFLIPLFQKTIGIINQLHGLLGLVISLGTISLLSYYTKDVTLMTITLTLVNAYLLGRSVGRYLMFSVPHYLMTFPMVTLVITGLLLISSTATPAAIGVAVLAVIFDRIFSVDQHRKLGIAGWIFIVLFTALTLWIGITAQKGLPAELQKQNYTITL